MDIAAPIEIFAPYTNTNAEGDTVLTFPLLIDGQSRKLTYTVSPEYAKYLVTERADAALVAMLPLVTRRTGEVKVHAPISAELLHNLRHILSPILPLYHPSYKPLSIEAEADETCFRRAGVNHIGTGCSCGVDSLATIYTYSKRTMTPESLRVDTLTFFDAGSHYGNQRSKHGNTLIIGRLTKAKACAADLKLPLLTVCSNLYSFGDGLNFESVCTYRNVSSVLILQKYFSTYHLASSSHIREFHFSERDPSDSDEFLLRCLSTESTRLLSAVSSLDRQERTALISHWQPARNHLNVCTVNVENCGRCMKCIRTLYQLEITGERAAFDHLFADKTAFRNGSFAERWHVLKKIMRDTYFHREYAEWTKRAESLGLHPPYSSRFLRFILHPVVLILCDPRHAARYLR